MQNLHDNLINAEYAAPVTLIRENPKVVTELLNAYKGSMARKAMNHSAKEYKFQNGTGTQPPPKQTQKTKKIIMDNFRKGYTSKLDALRNTQAEKDILKFKEIQLSFLEEINKQPCILPIFSEPNPSPSIKQLLGTVQKFFATEHSCPGVANEELFALLGLKIEESPPELLNYQKQIDCIKETDRQLEIRKDNRCNGFKPTALQREIMDCLDDGDTIAVRSPTGSGKTMLSLYLVHRMYEGKKLTIYVGPTKPICNEFALFVSNQIDQKNQDKYSFAIATEDYMNWEEIDRAKVLICTPNEIADILLFPAFKSLLPTVGAIIFDELPRMLSKDKSSISTLMLLASIKGWQTMVLSATMSDCVYGMLSSIFPNMKLIEKPSSIRPTDIVFRNGQDCTILPTTSLFPSWLLAKENSLQLALRTPITLEEFKKLYSANTQSQSTLTAVFPTDTTIQGTHMTNYAVRCPSLLQTDPIALESLDPDSNSDDEVDWETVKIVAEQEAKEVLALLKRLYRANLLPAMLFH